MSTPTSAPQTTIRIVGAPLDLGQSRRGVDLGPTALRYAGLKSALIGLGYRVEDRGNIETVERDSLSEEPGLGFLRPVVDACERIYEASREAMADGALPLVLGGDHSIAVGTVGGVSHGCRTGVLWIDAHGDFNTPETSPTGNLHGMPLAALCGHGTPEFVNVGRPGPKLQPEDVVLFGVRDLDPGEQELIHRSGVIVYTMRQIDERGVAPLAREALERLGHVDRIHLSLDMDSIDPREAPGVGTQVPGGLSYREGHLLMELIAEHGGIGSVDVVEVNPILDTRNQTAKLALGLLSSLFGRSIL
jgi:arginase